ncbi:MAG: DNA gyrase inhibitor YacG, partial [Candidatus Acidiferrales bacterium]
MQWRCPICQQPTDSAINADFPFCSERCRLIDLGQWADERYRLST